MKLKKQNSFIDIALNWKISKIKTEKHIVADRRRLSFAIFLKSAAEKKKKEEASSDYQSVKTLCVWLPN